MDLEVTMVRLLLEQTNKLEIRKTFSMEIKIRKADSNDIFALTELINELGYSTTQNEMKNRFEKIYNHPDFNTMLATIEDNIVGMVGATKNYSYEQNGIYIRVVALSVLQKFRTKGVGKKLMEAAESWAKEIGANVLLLNCGNRAKRKAAQLFYAKIGYSIKSSGFIKKLD